MKLTPEEMANPIAALRELNRKYMDMYDQAKPGEKLFVLRAYDVQTPKEEALLQVAIDQIEPAAIVDSEEAKVRREMEEMAAKGIEIDDPKTEAQWEAKLAAAREKDREKAEAEKERRNQQFVDEKAAGDPAGPKVSTPKVPPKTESTLSEVKGLGAKSIEKLLAAGVKTPQEFEALSYDQKKSIVGPLVADKFK